jgi:hypothetical protein
MISMRLMLNLLCVAALAGCANQHNEPAPKHLVADTKESPAAVAPISATKPADVLAKAPVRPYVLHLPGVSGESIIDHELRAGLRKAGFDGDIHIYDWTCKDPGIPALHARQRNMEQAAIVAERIVKQYRAAPDVPIYFTCHSGGAGPAIWALEQLPADVSVRCFVMISPALSPRYDLSKGLSHVTGKAYCFYSPGDDMVLGTGTRLFGTMDGVRTDAAGRVGFTKPAGSDEAQYAKLVSRPYESGWARFGNIGGHVGAMTTPFVQAVIGPMMLEKVLRDEELRAIELTVKPVMDILWPK